MRKRRLIAPIVAILLIPAACGGSAKKSDSAQPSSTIKDRLAQLSGAGVFVGGVAMTNNLVATHLDRTNPKAIGMRIFTTDGMPNGNAEWFEGKADADGKFQFTSTSGKAKIDGTIEPFDTDGTITFGDGVTRNFFTRPAGDGAGVFDIKVAPDGSWEGTSLDGSQVSANQSGDYVEGAVISSKGDRYPFRQNDLTRRLGYEVAGGAPDTYTTIVTRQATEFQGRGGDVRAGKPSANIVALDLQQNGKATPGVYHGRVAADTDRLNFEVKANPDGSRLVRSYVSDSEPEPVGDIEWFADTVTGSDFALTSKTGDAKVAGTIGDDGISGQITLPDGVSRKYFAAPSGQGAGIYNVEVASDRHHTGTSEQGAKLDLKYEDGTVMGTLTSPEGEQFPMLGADLATAYRYTDEFSKPGTYIAFVAPRGRYVFGRSGDVRGGRPGVNIIGLDKKC